MTNLDWLKKRLGVLEKRLGKAIPNSLNERTLRQAIRQHKKEILKAKSHADTLKGE